MKKILFTIALATLFSCNNKHTDPIQETKDSTEEKKTTFFPVTTFLKGQLISLDSMPFTPLLYTTINGKKDSVWLKKDQTKAFLQPFLTPEIDTTNLLNYFNETKFRDQTLNTITFTYDAAVKLPDTMQLRSWNVYVDPQSGNVLSIYLVKQFKENNQSYTQQLTWITDRSAKITTILNHPDGNTQLLKEQKIIWSDN